MIFGIPKEIKNKEDRVAITPDGVNTLVRNNHKVYIEKDAGLGSGFSNEDYEKAGAVLLDKAEEVYNKAEIVVKVKEPQPSEYKFLKKNYYINKYIVVDKIIQIPLSEKFHKLQTKLKSIYDYLVASKNIFTTIKYSFLCTSQELICKTNYIKNC